MFIYVYVYGYVCVFEYVYVCVCLYVYICVFCEYLFKCVLQLQIL